MGHGLITLNVADKNEIAYVSQFVPDIDWPDPNPTPSFYNARGMEVRNGIVYLCYDAGGVRIIDTADKEHPEEIGRFSNPVMNGMARAYNDLVLECTFAHVAVDYCGMEVLDVANPAAIALVGWWNPWTCHDDLFGWFTSPGYAVEVDYDAECQLVFLSTSKSDLSIVDVSNPADPESCLAFGTPTDTLVTWGIDIHGRGEDVLGGSEAALPVRRRAGRKAVVTLASLRGLDPG